MAARFVPPKLPQHVYDMVETELSRYKWTCEAIERAEDGYLSLSGQDDDGAGIVAHRSKLGESDPTGNAAVRMASDEDLATWRDWRDAIDAVYDRLPPTWRDLTALLWWSRDPNGDQRTAPWVARELGISTRTLAMRRAIIRWWLAQEAGLIPSIASTP